MPFLRSVGRYATILIALSALACGTKNSSTFGVGGSDGGPRDGASNNDGSPNNGGFNLADGSTSSGTLTVNRPSPLTVTVTIGQTIPTIPFSALDNGVPVTANWSTDQGGIATIDATGALQATGTAAGTVNVTASYGGLYVIVVVNVIIQGSQNGPIAGQALPEAGAGGFGGVGGEGVGGMVTDQGVLTALSAPRAADSGTGPTLLYPYDKTVWPLGLLAPLLQWSTNLGSASGISITLATSTGNFTWTGTFGPPALAFVDGGPGQFIRHPILQSIWDTATHSAGGTNTLSMQLTVAYGTGASAVAYALPASTWTVAPALLTGTVYYNSYGTLYVQNAGSAGQNGIATNGQEFGAAVLAIRSGDTAPTVAAGYTSAGSQAGCRVCHVVAGGGTKFIVQQSVNFDFDPTSLYTLNPLAETYLGIDGGAYNYDGVFAWAGLSYDGTLAFTNAAQIQANPSPSSSLWAMPPVLTGSTRGVPLTATGIPSGLKAGTPTFSTDTQHVAFTFLTSKSSPAIPGLSCTYDCLVAMDFSRSTSTFSNPRKLIDANTQVAFASFFPTNDSVIFHYQITPNNPGYFYVATGGGAKAQIWWNTTSGTGTAVPLNNLNGLNASGQSYLPVGSANGHANDTILNYEPTVNPVATGGYAWVVFTSRRMYGNVATQNAWLSDPRSGGYDYTNSKQITTKKLWVTAVDLGAAAGTDPSHPAFYLPAQEIQAGNSRGYWVLDPCKANGLSCTSGDQCCFGYCTAVSGAPTTLVCGGKPATFNCANDQEPCQTSSDCCNQSDLCLNNICTVPTPR